MGYFDSTETGFFLVPMAKKRYVQFRFRPFSRMEELLTEYNIPYQMGTEDFKGVKLVKGVSNGRLKYYKVRRNKLDGKGNYYSFAFASDIIQDIFKYYGVDYLCKDYIEENYSEKEKETNKEMNYALKQNESKLKHWYICHELGLKYNEWVKIRTHHKSLANSKLDKFLELTDTKRQEFINQKEEQKKINIWFNNLSKDDMDNLLKDFKISKKALAEEIGMDNAGVCNATLKKNTSENCIALMYYFFMDENNRRLKNTKSRKRRKKKGEPVKVSKVVKEEITATPEETKVVVDKSSETLSDMVTANNTLVALYEKEKQITAELEEVNKQVSEELNRYKYLIDLARTK